MSHWIWVDMKMGILMNDNEDRPNGRPHGTTEDWQHSGVWGPQQPFFEAHCLGMKVNSRESLQEEGHRKSRYCGGGKDPRLKLFNFICHSTLLSALLGRKKMKTCHSCPHCRLFLKCQHLAPHVHALITRSYCFVQKETAWKQQACVKTVADKWLVSNSLDPNMWPFPGSLHRWILSWMESLVKAKSSRCFKSSLLRLEELELPLSVRRGQH